jgi:hypothetical protein
MSLPASTTERWPVVEHACSALSSSLASGCSPILVLSLPGTMTSMTAAQFCARMGDKAYLRAHGQTDMILSGCAKRGHETHMVGVIFHCCRICQPAKESLLIETRKRFSELGDRSEPSPLPEPAEPKQPKLKKLKTVAEGLAAPPEATNSPDSYSAEAKLTTFAAVLAAPPEGTIHLDPSGETQTLLEPEVSPSLTFSPW